MIATGADPETDNALSSAIEWVAAVMFGQAATIMAVIAVASLGFIMLSGRLPMRRGVPVILGCFIIFSSGSVASGLLVAADQAGGEGVLIPAAPSAPVYTPTVPKAEPYDPYSGATVPDPSAGDILN
jgi:type IV secretory pathway VirB2 component (pilin)